MKYIASLCTLVVLLSSCQSSETAKPPEHVAPKDTVAAVRDFFPVPDYIGGQLRILDSLRPKLSKTITVEGKIKKAVTSLDELRQLAQNFREPDINQPALKPYYKATDFADQSIPSVTFMYTATDSTLPVKQLNVFIRPDPVENDKVTGIYMEKSFRTLDTVFLKRFYWKTAGQLQVVTERTLNGKTLPAEQIKIAWDSSGSPSPATHN